MRKNHLTDKTYASKRITAILLATIMIFTIVPSVHKSTASAVGNEIGTVKNVRVIRAGKDSLLLKWNSNSNANGYNVYRYDRVRKKYKNIANIKKSKNPSYLDKELKPGKVYKYKVQPYKKSDGKKTFGQLSYWVKARPYTKDSAKVNAGRITFEEKTLECGYREVQAAYADVYPSNLSKAKNRKPLSNTVRWYSSNNAIATVNKKGVIETGIKTGKCYIYAMAHNGLRNKITVTIKDYSVPNSFNLEGVEGDAKILFTEYKSELGKIAKYFHLNRPEEEVVVYLLDDTIESSLDEYQFDTEIYILIQNLLLNFKDEIIISADKTRVTITISEITGVDADGNEEYLYQDINYFYNHSLSDFDIGFYKFYEPAPHWAYSIRDPDEDDENDENVADAYLD